MQEIIIQKNDNGRRIDHFLFKLFPKVSKIAIFKAIRTKKIKVNKARVANNYRLQTNDVINIFVNFDGIKIENNFMDASDQLDIIYEDDNIILINKPCGVLSQKASSNDYDTINDRLLKYLYKAGLYHIDKTSVFKPALCNRLDRNTCGIIIGAKNFEALEEMNRIIKNHELKKQYYCLVENKPQREHDILIDYLFKDSKNNQVYISNQAKSQYMQIKTEYWLLGKVGKFFLLRVNLITGKTHQIRAHLAFHNLPIIGDGKYGTKHNNYPFQCLCSFKLSFMVKKSDSILFYLNDKSFEIKTKQIWFLKN